MTRQALVDMARRTLGHARAGTVPLAPGIRPVPAAHYVDPARFSHEVARIFRRLPLVLAFSAELATPGAYKAMDVAGTPVLLVRQPEGDVRAFVNMCSHRGAVVVEEGTGTARRFTCPYHAWTYDVAGALVGILDRERFGPLDPSCHGLTPLPAAERAGLVWAAPSGEAAVDLDTFLCGYGELLDHLGFATAHVVGRQVVRGPNWKVAYDGYLDLYHLPILHRQTFGADYANTAIYDAWGPHQRVSSPDQRMLALDGLPEEDWPHGLLVSGVWTIFPHVSVARFDAGGPLYLVSQLFPGPTVGDSTTVQTFLALREPDDERMGVIDKTMAFLRHVVEDEDYATGLRLQRALATGAKAEVLFGRNEAGGQRFHDWVDALVAAEDGDACRALFAAARTVHQ